MKYILESIVIFIAFNFARTEVSPNFARCLNQFFYQNSAPVLQGLVGSTQICQRLGNIYYYATEYDTNNRIPHYSAYTLSFDRCGSRFKEWFVEPQLAGRQDQSMVRSNNRNNNFQFGNRQAVDADYLGSGYDRGHLNPQLYHCETQDSRKATNALTNIAPQVPSFNQGIWNKFENVLYNVSKTYCNFVGARRYFITGVLPSNNSFISNGRVKVPTHYWTAVCCDSSGANGANRSEGWSAGFIGENVDNSSIHMYTIENFLPTCSSRLFADFTDQNGKRVKNCLFNPTKANNIINEINATNMDFIKHIEKNMSWLTYVWETIQNTYNAVYDFVSRMFG